MANTRNTENDFWRLVATVDGCLIWTGSLWVTGYGRFQYDNKQWKAHRLAWILSGRYLPKDMCLLHKCDNRKCVDPEHMMLGDRKMNNLDKVAKNRQSKGSMTQSAKITEKDVYLIRSSKETSFALADKYGLSWGHINKIRGKRAWTHVE